MTQAAVDAGFDHVKLKVGRDLADDIRRVTIAREVLGPDRQLMIDANQVWEVGQAIEWVNALAFAHPWFIEEPTSPDDVLGHAAIRRGIGEVKVATGEMCQNRILFKQFMMAGAVDVVQIDACRLGGVNEVLAVLLMAAKLGLPVCPHAGGVGLCEYVQHLSMIDYCCFAGTMAGAGDRICRSSARAFRRPLRHPRRRLYAAGAAGLFDRDEVGVAGAISVPGMIPRIDAHQHYWRIGQNDCVWPTPDLPIHRDYLPADLAPLMVTAGIAGSIVVQSQENDADTDWLCDLAAATPDILAVVGWVDMKRADAADRIATLAARAKVRGVRPMLQGYPDDWILDLAVPPALDAIEDHGLVFEALVRPGHLPAIARIASAWRGLSIVIDHAAKPDIAAAMWQPWADAIADIAAYPNVACKLSGLVTEAGPDWTAATLQPYVGHLLTVFGCQRLLWGSDWPVLDLASDYAGWAATSDLLLAGLEEPERGAVFGGNAERVYRLRTG